MPFVSICTPTFNRRPFIPYAIKCFLHQDYPKDRCEWIIIDDGTDPVSDLFINLPNNVKYFYVKDRMLLGKKRNYMHSKCSGDIIIYMDDDDYYPPQRVSHAVETLINNPNYLIAGSSEMHIYFDSKKSIYQCGPYKENHSTAATFAFRKELLKQTSFDDNDTFSEESKFLKGYKIPLIQLDPVKTILVFSHKHNSLNKENILEKPEQFKVQPSRYTVKDFIFTCELEMFYKYEMNELLVNYEPGNPNYKPQMLKAIKNAEEKREEKLKEIQSQQMLYNLLNKTNTNVNANESIKKYEKQLQDKTLLINELLKKIKILTKENDELKHKLEEKA